MTIRVTVGSKRKIKATVASGTIMARTLGELIDVDTDGIGDKYIIMYDANTEKYIGINPDTLLINAAEEPISPGLPVEFTQKMGTDLDNEIDLDGGVW